MENSSALLVDRGPMQRLAVVKADPGSPEEVFRELTAEEPKTLRQIAKQWRLPKGRFVEWFTTEHAALYEAALRVRADELANEALERADGADAETVAAAKLQVDTRLKLAEKWDRMRYGNGKDGPSVGITVIGNEDAKEMVRRIAFALAASAQRQDEKLIEGEAVEVVDGGAVARSQEQPAMVRPAAVGQEGFI